MNYEIPLEDETGITLCRVVWSGTLYEGSAQVAPITGHDDTAQHVANMILSRQDLRELSFRSEGVKPTIKGWNGYEGVVSALRIACPALGLQIGHIGGDVPPFERERTGEFALNDQGGGIE